MPIRQGEIVKGRAFGEEVANVFVIFLDGAFLLGLVRMAIENARAPRAVISVLNERGG
jgi:hypothetical protein